MIIYATTNGIKFRDVQSILFVGWILVRTRWVGFLELHFSHHLFFLRCRKQDFRDPQQVLVHIIPILGVTVSHARFAPWRPATMRTCMLNCCRPLIRPTWDSEAQKTCSAFHIGFFQRAVFCRCFISFWGFSIFRRACGDMFPIVVEKCWNLQFIHASAIFRKISEWNSFAARDISLRPLIPRGSPVIDLGVKATNSDMTPEGDSYQKSDG